MRAGTTHSRHGWKLAIGLAIALCAAGWFVPRPARSVADPVADSTTPNPHWQVDACQSCHKMAGNKPQAIAVGDVDHLCLKCHDGQHASAEVHPIARRLEPGGVAPPTTWPLVEGRLSCITCHDVRAACKVTPDMTPDDSMFLRGHEDAGPNAAGRDFCQNCHKYDGAKRFNPHLMLDSHKQVIEDRCLFCHEKIPDRNTMSRTGNSQLRFPQVVLCKSCHPNHKEILKGGHLNLKATAEIAAYMRAREIIGLVGPPSEDLVNQLKAQKARPTRMYLEPDGGVTCATCHNPHPEGLFPVGSVLYYRTMHVMDGHPVSPVHSQEFCRNCHKL